MQHRGVLGGQLVGGGQRAGERERAVEERHRAAVVAFWPRRRVGPHASFERRAGDEADLLSAALLAAHAPAESAALRALARNMRSRCVWMTLSRIWGSGAPAR